MLRRAPSSAAPTVRWAIPSRSARGTDGRLTGTTVAGTTTYVNDDANRLTSVGGAPYTWSHNGNLLSDGTYTYVYDHANRLTSATWGTLAYGFAYNGLGRPLRLTDWVRRPRCRPACH